MHGTNATEFKTGEAYQTGDAKFDGQVTVKCNTKVFDRVRHGDRCTTCSHRAWEGGKRDLDFLPEDTIIASVLWSLSLSSFAVIQVLTSSIHLCMESKRSGI